MEIKQKIVLAPNKGIVLYAGAHRFDDNVAAVKIDGRIMPVRDYNKVFCIGFGKTGTTSLEAVLRESGFQLGNQAVGEMLIDDWNNGQFDKIIRLAHSADAFQDVPFGFPGVFRKLDSAFPGSRFILTVRDSADVWFDSLVRFHMKKFSSTPGSPPSEADLANSCYRYRGYMLDVFKTLFKYPDVPLYDAVEYKNQYLRHNDDVRSYFSGRADFLELNVASAGAYRRLCEFLSLPQTRSDFPWKNKS